MSQAAQVIALQGGIGGEPIVREAITAAASTVKPGELVEVLAAGTIQEHSTAGAIAPARFALTNLANGETIDDAYAVGALARYATFQPGQRVNAFLPANAAAIVIGDKLSSNGDGTLRKATSTDTKASLFVDGAAANGGVTYTSKLDGDHGNDIQIIQLDAGTGAVTVDGLVITVTPDTGANTATDVVAQIVADGGANSLVTAVAEGSGAGEPGTVTVTNLAGGLDAETGSDEAIVAEAIEAVDNSAGGSPVRLQVEIV